MKGTWWTPCVDQYALLHREREELEPSLLLDENEGYSRADHAPLDPRTT